VGLWLLFLRPADNKNGPLIKSTPEERWEIIQEYCMVSDASASTERPLPNVLSDREILLKAANFAIAEGRIPERG
jgi:hypothetical protein